MTSFNSSISSLTLQRFLARATAGIESSFNRLSSGKRINKASDDAAGLGLSSILRTSQRVYTRGIQNANDGLSLLNIVDGDLGQMSEILTRIRELATQSANGTLSSSQRQSLNAEAQQLAAEYNRITQVSKFNGRSLLDGSLGNVSIQMGFGTSQRINFNVAQNIGESTAYATNTFGNEGRYGSGPSTMIEVGDLNNDGYMDIVTNITGSPNRVGTYFGNASGTFTAGGGLTASGTITGIKLANLRSTGLLDVVAVTATEINVFENSGTGTFGLAQTTAPGGSLSGNFVVDDFTGGLDLIAVGDTTNDQIRIISYNTFTGFKSYATIATGAGNPNPEYLVSGNFDNANNIDIGFVDSLSGSLRIFIESGGSYTEKTNLLLAVSARSLSTIDYNGDGNLDLVFGTNSSQVYTYIGNGSGAFSAGFATSLSSQVGAGKSITNLQSGDVDGDGRPDLLFAASGYIGYMRSNGVDGYFSPAVAVASAGATDVVFGDFNHDGFNDLASNSSTAGAISAFNQLTLVETSTALPEFDLLSKANALDALETIDEVLEDLRKDQADIGSAQSRISSAISALQALADNYGAADARITDADTAQEVANLMKNQILANLSSSLLAQANQAPQIALSLLQSA